MYSKSNITFTWWYKAAVIFSITILLIAFLLFLAIWVIFPVVFMSSISVQTLLIFLNIDRPAFPEFTNPAKYDLNGTVNFFITTKDHDDTSVSIGSWLIMPEKYQNVSVGPHTVENAVKLLANTSYPVILYMHGVYANRAKPIYTYMVLRKKFLIIAIDYRGYGDSSNLQPTELSIVNDTIQIYQWIRKSTQNEIYVWGHSLGSALSTHVVRRLKEESGIVPMGLFLESPMTTMREEIPRNPIGKLFAWLTYFNQTIQDPLEANGFHFKTSSNILYVDCPIMIMHAEDDRVIPWEFGKKLTEVATTQRNIPTQGNVTYYQFDEKLGYSHMYITTNPHLSDYIGTFVAQCRQQNKMQR